MTRVLFVDDDAAFVRHVSRELRRKGLDVLTASTSGQALEKLGVEQVDVIVTDLLLEDSSGIALLEQLRVHWPAARTVLISGFASARDYETAMGLGAVRVLCKPFTIEQLEDAIVQAAECGVGFRGSVHGLGLVDLLQMYHFGQRSVAIAIDTPTRGRIVLEGGQVVHAELGETMGEPALLRMLSLRAGALRTEPSAHLPIRTVERDFQTLLLDCLRQIDEGDPALPSLRPRPTLGHPGLFEACSELLRVTDGGLASGVVALESGLLLALCDPGGHGERLAEVWAAATAGTMRSTLLAQLDRMLIEREGGILSAPLVEELQLATRRTLHFAKTLGTGRAAVVLVTSAASNVGMSWARLKAALPSFEQLVP